MNRALAAVDALAGIGSPVALGELCRVTRHSCWSPVRWRARRQIEAAAVLRDITVGEFEERYG